MPPKAVPEGKIGARDQNNRLETIKKLPPPEVFDALFDKWAGEVLQAVGFPASD